MRAAYIRPGSRQAAIAAASVGAAVDVAYVLLMQSQGIEFGPRVVFYTAFVAVMAALSLASAAVGKLDERFAQALLYGAATGYLAAGIAGLASIGLPLVGAGLLAYVAAGPRRVSVGVASIPVVLSASALIIGMALS